MFNTHLELILNVDLGGLLAVLWREGKLIITNELYLHDLKLIKGLVV